MRFKEHLTKNLQKLSNLKMIGDISQSPTIESIIVELIDFQDYMKTEHEVLYQRINHMFIDLWDELYNNRTNLDIKEIENKILFIFRLIGEKD